MRRFALLSLKCSFFSFVGAVLIYNAGIVDIERIKNWANDEINISDIKFSELNNLPTSNTNPRLKELYRECLEHHDKKENSSEALKCIKDHQRQENKFGIVFLIVGASLFAKNFGKAIAYGQFANRVRKDKSLLPK
jgi:hypothetical protein